MSAPLNTILIVLLIAVGLGLALLVPVNLVITPEWTVSVMDENNIPIPDAVVTQIFEWPYSESGTGSMIQITNQSGVGIFPRRSIRTAFLERVVLCIGGDNRTYVKRWVWDCRSRAQVIVRKPGFGVIGQRGEVDFIWSGDSISESTSVHLIRCEHGGMGPGCPAVP